MNDRTKAVRMAQNDIETVIKSFRDEGHFMDDSKGTKAQAVKDRIASSPDATALIEQGFTQSYADRVAKARQK